MKFFKYNILSILLFAISTRIIFAQEWNQHWPVLKTYKDKYLDEVAMPLGGIGTGTVSIGGRGDLRDWELMNRGALGYLPAFKLVEPTISNGPFFALYYKQQSGEANVRVLEGPVSVREYYGDWGADAVNSGFPRFESTGFAAAYPLAQINFEHKAVPVDVRLEAFNPLVVGDADKSGIPVAVLRYVLTNNTDRPIETSVVGMVPNYIGVDGWSGEPKGNYNSYRDWHLSGDDAKLKEMWPYIKKAMSFAWTGIWDTDKDGVMEGSQHNTMDINYVGPNPQMAAWYLGALKAAEHMAAHLGDKAFAKECGDLYIKGRKWIDANIFNGEYYEHHIPEAASKVAQLGKGCLVDQLVGQYLAHTTGLGYVLDKDHVQTTLKSIMKYNYVDNFNEHFNTFRSFGLGDEAGLVMASYPRGDLLDFPFPYYTEIMTGFEYSTAAHMIYEGQIESGLKVFKAIRDRYDGYKRNIDFHMATCLVQQVQRKILTVMWWPASTLLTAYKMRYGETGRPGVFAYGPIKMFPIPASAGVKHWFHRRLSSLFSAF